MTKPWLVSRNLGYTIPNGKHFTSVCYVDWTHGEHEAVGRQADTDEDAAVPDELRACWYARSLPATQMTACAPSPSVRSRTSLHDVLLCIVDKGDGAHLLA